MRLLKHKWIKQDIVLDNEKVNVLVLENKKFFRDFLSALNRQIEDDEDFLVFSQNLKHLDLSKSGILLTDLVNIPIDEKKATTLITKDLTKTNKDEITQGLAKVNKIIAQFIDDIIYDYSLPLSFNNEISLASLLKAVELKPELISDNYLNSLLAKVKASVNLMNKDLFFIVNLHDFLDEDELSIFYKELRLIHIDLVIIDAREPKNINKEFEITTVIDNDLCEILK